MASKMLYAVRGTGEWRDFTSIVCKGLNSFISQKSKSTYTALTIRAASGQND